ncbi:MAG: hypothetical protein GXO55_03775 [Chloroflexi bacterium]|nr:hypothetical protein [Chloroflexota bacterium]
MNHRVRRTGRWFVWAWALWLLCFLAWMPGAPVRADAPEPHQYIEEYEGPRTCEICHPGTVDEVVHGQHYLWSEKLDHYSPIPGTIARINWLGVLNEKLQIPGGCGRCHIGGGALPKPPDQLSKEEKARIDCLICHSPTYDMSQRFPVRDEEGRWVLPQDRRVVTARNAQRPTAEMCLRCHLNVGGGPLLKRGVDFAPIADKHGESSKGDVHADAGMVCADCHRAEHHRFLGYGPTIWGRDVPEKRLTCEACHGTTPHQNDLLNEHTRLDCRTCHIPGTGGLVFRDWTAPPVYDPVNELYMPVSDVREPNTVPPVFRWFNGQPTKPGHPWPGSREDESARIQPFKAFRGVIPVDAESGQPLPLKLGIFFTQGDLEKAIQVGAKDAGVNYSGRWQGKEVTVYLQISHGVVGKEDARTCRDCHVPDGVMDFSALGYTEEEKAKLTALSAATAGTRPPLTVKVVVPPPKPLPTPAPVSLQASPPPGIHMPWEPVRVTLVSLLILALGGWWLVRNR